MRIRTNYAPSQRLGQVRELLHSTGGLSLYQIADRLEVTTMTARRYLRALEDAGVPIYDELGDDGKTKIWRVHPGDRRRSIEMSVAQMIALYLARGAFGFLDGTGFKEDLDEVFRTLEVTLQSKRFLAVKNLDRKLVSLHEAHFVYDDCIDDVNDIITALIQTEQLRIVYRNRSHKPFVIDPYTLAVHRGGLYLVAYSHKSSHQAVRTFAVDELREVERLRGQRFEYPQNFEPARMFEHSFGVFVGEPQLVRLRLLTPDVRQRARRRRYHPSQQLKKNGRELTMRVYVSAALENWILGFGEKVEVLAPAELRATIAERHRASADLYPK